mmetsp:Transcript_19740/g.78614  ORF Transcript_19740/g.78614 Transcript_19740/m.78614 type:complete len:568 (+) Transcript_19740:124-1827(+)
MAMGTTNHPQQMGHLPSPSVHGDNAVLAFLGRPREDEGAAALGRGRVVEEVRIGPHDCLVAAAVRAAPDDVAARLQVADDVLADARLDRDRAAVGHEGAARRIGRALVVVPRRVARLLQAEAVIDEIRDDLRLALRLHEAAHDAEREPRLVVLEGEARHDGVVRPLPRRVDVGVVLLEREQSAAVLQREAADRELRAEAVVVGLDERDHVAVLRRGGQVGRVAERGQREVQCSFTRLLRVLLLTRGRALGVAREDGRRAGVDGLRRDVGIDERAALRRVVLGEEPRHRDVGEVGVGVVLCRVGVRELLRLDVGVQRVGRVEPRQLEAFEDVEHLQRREALRVGRELEDAVRLAVRRVEQFVDPLAAVRLEVVGVPRDARDVLGGEQLLRDGAVAAIKRVAAVGGERPQRLGEARVREDVALGGRLAAVRRVELVQRVRILAVRRRLRLVDAAHAPLVRDDLRDREAFLGVLDGRLEELVEGEHAEPRVQVAPAHRRARDGDAERSRRRHDGGIVVRHGGTRVAHLLEPKLQSSAAGAVVAHKTLVRLAPNDCHEVTTWSTAHRLDES